MSDYILNISFFLGVVLLGVSIFLLVSVSLRKRFDNTPQKIEVWGLKLEVSILTLLVLISVGLIAINIWFQLQHINDQINQVEKDRIAAVKRADELNRELENVKKKDFEAYITLAGVNKVSSLNPKFLSCSYTTKSGDRGEGILEFAPGDEKFKVTFKNLTRETIITSLDVTDQQGEGTIWSSHEEYQPLKPHTFALAK